MEVWTSYGAGGGERKQHGGVVGEWQHDGDRVIKNQFQYGTLDIDGYNNNKAFYSQPCCARLELKPNRNHHKKREGEREMKRALKDTKRCVKPNYGSRG